MEKFKEIIEKTYIYDNGDTKKTKKTLLHTIKNWSELTREEKEKKIEEYAEDISYRYHEDMYEDFKCELENIQDTYKNIKFDDVYLDSNSQGIWIDRVCNFKYVGDTIDIYGETLEVEDVDLHIRKYIDDEDFEIYLYDYYIDEDKMNKIKRTKKYKTWIENIRKEIKAWIEDVNNVCENYMMTDNTYPYDLDDEDDKYYLDMYFEVNEFEDIEEIENDR